MEENQHELQHLPKSWFQEGCLQEGRHQRGGRLSHFAARWPSKFLQTVLAEGIRINWVNGPPRKMDFGEFKPTSAEEMEIFNKEQTELLRKGAVEPAPPGHCIFKQFLVDKQGSKEKRPVINMRPLSPYVLSPHFKMEGIRAVKEVIDQEDWAVRVDLKDAYLHCLLRRQDRTYVQYRFQGHVFQWRVLPFGYRDSPRVFQKLMLAAVRTLRESGVRIIVYLDDVLLLAKGETSCRRDRDRLLRRLVKLGLGINLTKSMLRPRQTVTFLGIEISIPNLQLSLPEPKLAKTLRIIKKVLKRADRGREITTWELQSLLGTLQSLNECVLPTRLRQNACFELLTKAEKAPTGRILVSEQVKNDMLWWRDNLKDWNGRAIIPPTPDHTIEVDASDLGLGGVLVGEEGQTIVHSFFQDGRRLHINERELMAAAYVFKTFATRRDWTDCGVRIRTDSLVAMTYLNKMGGRRPRLCRVTEEIHNLALQRGITLSAEWIPGKENSIADRVSRIQGDFSSSRLHPELFDLIKRRFGKMDIDLFASELNRQVSRYVSRGPEPLAWYVDTFSRPLPKGLAMYAFPPFILMGRLLAKIRREKATVVVVAPFWTGQPWWPWLTRMTTSPPLLLPQRPDMLILPSQLTQQAPTWTMGAFLVSGEHY